MKNLFNWRDKQWQGRAMAMLAFVVLLMIVSHAELRLLFPLIDALDIDVLLTLLGVQFIRLYYHYVKPTLRFFYRKALLPLAGTCHWLLMFFSGSFGHCITEQFYRVHMKFLPDTATYGTPA